MVRRVLILPLFTALLSAQTKPASPAAPQVPAEVDHALRTRVTAFYTLLVNHQFRRAEEFVAQDTRDIYYEREKPRFLGFTISSIKYADDFTRAEVITNIKMPPLNPMFPAIGETPVTSIWRLEDGAWFWSVPKMSVTDLLKGMSGLSTSADATPSAGGGQIIRVTPGSDPAATAPASATPNLPQANGLPGGMGTPDALAMATAGGGAASAPLFSADHADVTLKGTAVEKVTITNNGQTEMSFFILGELPNVSAKFDKTQIKAGEKCVLSMQAKAGAKDGMLLIGVTGTRQMLALPVTIK